MNILDEGKFEGRLRIKVFKIIDGVKTLINEFDNHNLITLSGFELITFLLVGAPGSNKITKVGVGDGTNTPHEDDVGLSNAYIRAINSYTYPKDNVVEFRIAFDSCDANGLLISEFGLFSEGLQLFSRKLLTEEGLPAIPKDSDIIIEGYWSIQIFECKVWSFASAAEIKYITTSDIT